MTKGLQLRKKILTGTLREAYNEGDIKRSYDTDITARWSSNIMYITYFSAPYETKSICGYSNRGKQLGWSSELKNKE